MPLTIEDKGARNRVEIPPDTREKLNGVIRLSGDDNVVSFGEQCVAQTLDFDLRGKVQVQVADACRLGGLRIHAIAGGSIRIGARTIFNSRSRLLMHEAGNIVIGARCLFGGDCTLTVSDMHSILDAASGQRINAARDVEIGEHVWLGEGVMVLKGATIGRDSVVGARGLVSGAIPAASLAVGVPARVVREGVTWDNRLL